MIFMVLKIWRFKKNIGCLLHWLEQDPTCPTCRRQLLQGSEEANRTPHPRSRENTSSMSWTGWSRLLQQNTDTPVVAAAENSQLESLAEQVREFV